MLELRFHKFCCFCGKSLSFRFFTCLYNILERFECSLREAHMQSIHACACQTQFFEFVFFSQTTWLRQCKLSHLGVNFGSTCDIPSEKMRSKNWMKERCFTRRKQHPICRSRGPWRGSLAGAHFNKKQSFEQQFIHCVGFLQKKTSCARLCNKKCLKMNR